MTRRTFIAAVAAVPLLVRGQSVTAVIPERPALDVPKLLRCIAEIETGNDDRKIGRRGERSRYQLKLSTWVDRWTEHHDSHRWSTRVIPHYRTQCHGWYAQACAEMQVAWLRRQLSTDSPYWLYFAWNAGINRTKLAIRDSRVLWMYHGPASRLQNLYYDA